VVTCKVCGFENDKGAQFCGNCGSFLEWTGEKDAEPAPPPDTTQATGTTGTTGTTPPDGGTGPTSDTQPILTPPPPPAGVVCSTCGTVNPPDRVFCQNCAAELNPVDTTPITTTQTTRTGFLAGREGPAIAIAAVGVVAVIAILFLSGILGGGAGATPSPSIAQL